MRLLSKRSASRRPSAKPPLSDHLRFVLSWASDPLQVAAIVPSGAALTALITRDISVHDAPVLEFGPGTGVFTRELIGRGIKPADLTLVERGSDFAALLRDRFPGARVLHADAAQISPGDLFPVKRAGAVVSGLGFLSMPPLAVKAILRNAFECMRADGAFYQFTYGFRCPVSRSILSELGLNARRIGGTMRNLPPASVYRISRPTSFLDLRKSIHP